MLTKPVTVTSDSGTYDAILYIHELKQTFTSSGSMTPTALKEFLSTHIDGADALGGTFPDRWNDTYYLNVTNVAPLTLRVKAPTTNVRVTGKGGYYVTAAMPAQSHTMYTNTGAQLSGTFYIITLRGIYAFEAPMYHLVAQHIENGIVSGALYYVGITVDNIHQENSKQHAIMERICTASQGIATCNWLNSIESGLEITDPYSPGGTSIGEIGGTGDFDNTGDDIDFPPLPSLGATNTGFISLFNPTLQELKDLSSYMWSSSFDIALYKKLFADPMECILGLSIVPVSVPDAGRGFISVGNLVTPVWMNRAGAQYIEVDCGSINVNEYWGAYLDYEPYTKAEIYLPYCGIHPISIDDIMGKTVAVKYHVDILSGACCAYVKCGNAVLYTFIGQCASSIPITGNDWTNVINGVLSAAVSVGTMVATGGLTAPMAVSSVASTAVNGIKPSIEKSGAMGGTGGMLAIQTPYLILTRPRQALPEGQNTYLGYPSYITASLGLLSGYTEIENVHLHDIPATSEELSEIENLLKSGVIL